MSNNNLSLQNKISTEIKINLIKIIGIIAKKPN